MRGTVYKLIPCKFVSLIISDILSVISSAFDHSACALIPIAPALRFSFSEHPASGVVSFLSCIDLS